MCVSVCVYVLWLLFMVLCVKDKSNISCVNICQRNHTGRHKEKPYEATVSDSVYMWIQTNSPRGQSMKSETISRNDKTCCP